jgi:Asp-tRNA(Asn)/Glu-tRNA(Gln) amidotransferase C subunit
MDLDKLAKLSCLDIKNEDREYFSNSLADVVKIMDTVSILENKAVNDNLSQSVLFDELNKVEDSNQSHRKENVFIDRAEQYTGIHLEQGVFLAPKVIKKD